MVIDKTIVDTFGAGTGSSVGSERSPLSEEMNLEEEEKKWSGVYALLVFAMSFFALQ